jgi:hypothetical protein
VRGYPLNWTTFEGQRAARYQKIFHDPRHVITTVSKQPMKTHTDPQTPGDPVQHHCAAKRGPTPKEKRRNSGDMAYNQENSGAPADSLAVCSRPSAHSFMHSLPFCCRSVVITRTTRRVVVEMIEPSYVGTNEGPI